MDLKTKWSPNHVTYRFYTQIRAGSRVGIRPERFWKYFDATEFVFTVHGPRFTVHGPRFTALVAEDHTCVRNIGAVDLLEDLVYREICVKYAYFPGLGLPILYIYIPNLYYSLTNPYQF